MESSTLQRSRTPTAETPEASATGARRPLSALHWTIIGAVALLGISTALILWARTRPGFDPYGWLVWGHQSVTGSLDTNAAPSWKPLPFLFTVPYALFGHYQVWLWMITSLAVSLSGVVFAGRIAHRLTLLRSGDEVGPRLRWAAWAAALFAGAALLGVRDYWHYMLSAQSDPMIVALCLAAVDCHLSGRRRWAFALGALASLGRPEVWPFLAAYAIWAWLRVPEMRWLIAAGVLVLLALWFGVPALTSRSPFVAGTNALGSGRALHSNRVFGTIDRFLDLHETPLEVLALLSALYALWRRDRVVVALSLGAVVWVIVEIAFALHGWPGLPRYMFEAAAMMVVIAAVGIGRLLADAPRLSVSPRVALWGSAAVALAIAGSLVPAAISRGRTERADLKIQRLRTKEISRLSGTISRLGGATLLRQCGEPLTRLEYQTILAWALGVNVSRIGFKYSQAIAHGNPIVLFTPVHDGWKVQAVHQRLPACKRLPGL
jgi:hypothetical protein